MTDRERDEIDELVDWQLRHLREYQRDGFCQHCTRQRLLNVRGFCRQCMDDLAAEWDTSIDEPVLRHIIIASRPSDARRYAQRHGIQRPIVVDLDAIVPDSVLRGITLDGYRIHDISGGLVPPSIMARLRQLAAFAGRPLESFYADTTEQAA